MKEDLRHHLGQQLRRLRSDRRMSLRVLGHDAGCSASLLSQIENGRSFPSVDLLVRLAGSLGVSTDDLLGTQTDRRQPHTDVRRDLLLRALVLEPGDREVSDQMAEPGTVEFVYVAEGHLTVSAGADSYVLAPGSSVQLDPMRCPLYLNQSDSAVRAVWGRLA